MTLNPILFGVLSTIFVEMLLIFIVAGVIMAKQSKK